MRNLLLHCQEDIFYLLLHGTCKVVADKQVNGYDPDRELKFNFTGDQEFVDHYSLYDLNDVPIYANIYRIANYNESTGKYEYIEELPFEIDELMNANAVTLKSMTNFIMENRDVLYLDNIVEFTVNSFVSYTTDMKGMYAIVFDNIYTDLNEYYIYPLFLSSATLNFTEWTFEVQPNPLNENTAYQLEIITDLTSYNTSLGECPIIYSVIGENNGKIVYDNVVNVTFDSAGQKPMLLDIKVPAGTIITVKQIYSGGSYYLYSDESISKELVANDVNSFEFYNEYDEMAIYSTGINNYFDYTVDEGWRWTRKRETTEE